MRKKAELEGHNKRPLTLDDYKVRSRMADSRIEAGEVLITRGEAAVQQGTQKIEEGRLEVLLGRLDKGNLLVEMWNAKRSVEEQMKATECSRANVFRFRAYATIVSDQNISETVAELGAVWAEAAKQKENTESKQTYAEKVRAKIEAELNERMAAVAEAVKKLEADKKAHEEAMEMVPVVAEEANRILGLAGHAFRKGGDNKEKALSELKKLAKEKGRTIESLIEAAKYHEGKKEQSKEVERQKEKLATSISDAYDKFTKQELINFILTLINR